MGLGERNAMRVSYSLPFLLVGVVAYGLASVQGTAEAFRSANLAWHFTHFTVGHSHLAAVGFVSFLIWGSVYGLLPRDLRAAPEHEARKAIEPYARTRGIRSPQDHRAMEDVSGEHRLDIALGAERRRSGASVREAVGQISVSALAPTRSLNLVIPERRVTIMT
jgi:hypothetical protein